MKKLSFEEHQEHQKKKGIVVLRNPSHTRSEELARRRNSSHDYQATIPALVKEELGKYIPAGRFKNIPAGNR